MCMEYFVTLTFGFVTTSDVYFSVDSLLLGNFSYRPDGNGTYTYNELLFSTGSLPHGPHTLNIQNGEPSGISSLRLLDYLVSKCSSAAWWIETQSSSADFY